MIHPLCAFKHSERDYDRALVFLSVQIDEVNQFYGNSITPAGIGILAKQIIRSYPHLTPDDIGIFTGKVLAGEYGKCYGALTPAVLMDWLASYKCNRDEEIEEIAYQDHESRKYGDAPRGAVRYCPESAELANKYAQMIIKELNNDQRQQDNPKARTTTQTPRRRTRKARTQEE